MSDNPELPYRRRHRDSAEKEKHAQADSDRRADQQQNSKVRRSIARHIKRLRNQFAAAQKEQSKTESKKIFLEGATLIAVIITVALTGGTFAVFYGQLGEMKRAYGPLKDSADAAKTAADAAKQQADIALYDQRPWVGTTKLDTVTIKSGQIIVLNLHYRNSGKTPANILDIKPFIPVPFDVSSLMVSGAFRSDLIVFDQAQVLNQCLGMRRNFGTSTVFPGSEIDLIDQQSFPSSEAVATEIAEKRRGFYALGCLWYQAPYQQATDMPYVTGYCYYFVPVADRPNTYTVGLCPHYNFVN